MAVDGTGGAGSKWIKKSYPEIDREPIALIPEESHVSKVMKEGIDV